MTRFQLNIEDIPAPAASGYLAVTNLIAALTALHPRSAGRDPIAYQAAITDMLRLTLRQPAPPLHLITHAALQTIERVLHTSRQLVIVVADDLVPDQAAAFEDDLNRMCVITRAYLGRQDEEDPEYERLVCTGCGAGAGFHRDGCPVLLPDPLPTLSAGEQGPEGA